MENLNNNITNPINSLMVGKFAQVSKACEFCGQELKQIYIEHNGVKRYTPGYYTCECEQAQAAKAKEKEEKAKADAEEKRLIREQNFANKIKRLIGESGMSARALSCRFDGLQVNFNNAEALKKCNEFVKTFTGEPQSKKNGLIIAGPCGVGKSHLSFAVANELLAQGYSVIGMTMIELLMKLRSAYKSDEKTEDEILKVYEDCSLLIIDDFGKEKPTEWALQMMYTIIDRRYNSMRPIILTTNYNSQELKEKFTLNGDTSSAAAVVDRLEQMCEFVKVGGESYRRR